MIMTKEYDEVIDFHRNERNNRIHDPIQSVNRNGSTRTSEEDDERRLLHSRSLTHGASWPCRKDHKPMIQPSQIVYPTICLTLHVCVRQSVHVHARFRVLGLDHIFTFIHLPTPLTYRIQCRSHR